MLVMRVGRLGHTGPNSWHAHRLDPASAPVHQDSDLEPTRIDWCRGTTDADRAREPVREGRGRQADDPAVRDNVLLVAVLERLPHEKQDAAD